MERCPSPPEINEPAQPRSCQGSARRWTPPCAQRAHSERGLAWRGRFRLSRPNCKLQNRKIKREENEEADLTTVLEREKSSYAAHLIGRPGALKIKVKLGGTFQIFNPTFGVCVEPQGGNPRQTVGLLR
jgi:hypothetical protein